MMPILRYPDPSKWEQICKRHTKSWHDLVPQVQTILAQVYREGDTALHTLTAKYDGVELHSLCQGTDAKVHVPKKLRKAIEVAKSNIEQFHRAQQQGYPRIETMPGVTCWMKNIPIERVGLYVPGGSAPLFSTLLMLGIPAKLAGCGEIVVCSPPGEDGQVNDTILYTARLIGIDRVYAIGGAQAIGAMAYGTERIPKVDKIFGPGNPYVTLAKQLVQQKGTSIDIPAGPSEVLVIADSTCNPVFVAADLLSQAEHGPDSQVVLISDSEPVIENVLKEMAGQIEELPRKEIAAEALVGSMAVLVSDPEEAMAFSNVYAPEHLILATAQAELLADKVVNAGSVFLGNYSCESAGDYASGTNHTLPTDGYARCYSGVTIDSFVKKVSFQRLTAEGIQNIGPSIEQMAMAEGLQGHKEAVSIRLKAISDV